MDAETRTPERAGGEPRQGDTSQIATTHLADPQVDDAQVADPQVDDPQANDPQADDVAELGDRWSRENCSVARALEVLGTRSTLLVLREAFLGTRRFDDFARRVGITESVAAARLRDLVANGLLERHPYREPGQRTRHEYRLTAKGRDLLPVVLSLMTWGDKYLADPGGPPLVVTHAGCGAPLRAEARCAAGHLVAAQDARSHARSGAEPTREATAR